MKNVVLIIISIFLIRYAAAQIPATNQDIVKYVNSVIGKKVGRGECWDLAHDALEHANAKWDHKYEFGCRIDPVKDTVYPGDIIQFKNVVMKFKSPKGLVTENYPQHTAIVYEVTAPGAYKIAHQNTDYTGKKVGLSTLRLADKKSGKWQFFRPEAK
jgi:hypothetical protein